MREILLLAFAGALGTLGRYGLSGWAYRLMGERFPYGTLAVNITGCLLIGFVMQTGLVTEIIPRTYRFVITMGFLGAFTTFSTFSYETLRYVENGAWLFAIANAALNLVLGLSATWAGFAAANTLFGGVR